MEALLYLHSFHGRTRNKSSKPSYFEYDVIYGAPEKWIIYKKYVRLCITKESVC